MGNENSAGSTDRQNRRPRIYVCSPLRPKAQEPEQAGKELEDNLDRARRACRLVADLGAVPVCSHLFCTQFLDDSIPSEREQGRRIGLELLKDADELWCFSEFISEGMLVEIAGASAAGIPVRMMCETAGVLMRMFQDDVEGKNLEEDKKHE